MAEGTGQTGDAVAAARAGVARRDEELADADRRLAATLSAAHRVAEDAVRRLEAIRADIDRAVAGYAADTSTGAAELARFLLARQREIADVVADAEAEARAKTAVLKELTATYAAQNIR